MSTFKGIFEEIPGIAADRFDADCLKSKFLFLSHCHADHMVGLSQIVNLSIPLFTSEISAVFLKKQFPNLSSAIEIIELESPLELTYTIDETIMELIVTALPAKHCPGSVMFVFETSNRTLLYTGDFRILKSHFNQYKILECKTIDSMHLDSTFLSDRFNEFPTQIESTIEICLLIREWLEAHNDNKIVIEMPAQYGVEFLFMAIESKLRQKIYVNEKQWQKYVYLPAMDKCITPDASKCRIFTKFKSVSRTNPNYTNRYRIIKPSAMFWKDWKYGQPIVKKTGDRNEYRVAYSNHCSCLELKDFLEFTQPKRVSLNVVPENCELSYINCLKNIYLQKNEDLEVLEKQGQMSFENISFLPNATYIKRKTPKSKLPPKRLKL